VRHALAEYDIAYHLVRSGDNLSVVLGRAPTSARTALRRVPASRERNRA
jgi:hypothetical protein